MKTAKYESIYLFVIVLLRLNLSLEKISDFVGLHLKEFDCETGFCPDFPSHYQAYVGLCYWVWIEKTKIEIAKIRSQKMII